MGNCSHWMEQLTVGCKLMAIKFISYIKHFFKIRNGIYALIFGGLLSITLTACTNENSTTIKITPPDDMYSINITNMSLNEIYDEVCIILSDTLGDHILTRVEGVLEAKDDQIRYDSLVFYFERDVAGNFEGGGISVLTISFDSTKGENTINIDNFIGPSKAYMSSSVPLLTDDNTFVLVEEEFHAQSFDKPMRFKVWRTITNMEEEQRKPDIRFYDIGQDENT